MMNAQREINELRYGEIYHTVRQTDRPSTVEMKNE